MNVNGYNALAIVCVVCAAVLVGLGKDVEVPLALLGLAGTVAGRGSSKEGSELE